MILSCHDSVFLICLLRLHKKSCSMCVTLTDSNAETQTKAEQYASGQPSRKRGAPRSHADARSLAACEQVRLHHSAIPSLHLSPFL